MLRHMAHTPFWLVLMVHQAVISYQKFSVPLLSLIQKKIADFTKLPCDASLCTAAETAISNLETEHGITIKGSRGPTVWKSPPLTVQYFWIQVVIPYFDTLIANINSRFSGEVVELVASASYSTPLFFLMMGHFSELIVTLSCKPWLISMEKKQR